MTEKRKVELVVISDVHLGTLGCHARELYAYLDSIAPDKLILNGDIIDIWQFRKSYFPKSHLAVIKKIIDLSVNGTEVVYLTGNHDEMLRKFSETTLGGVSIKDKLVLELDGKKAWFFHGDIFDVSIQKAKWIAKLGSWGYSLLILLNHLLNWGLTKMGRKRYSLSRKIKSGVKRAVKFIGDFEKAAAELAIEKGYKYVICGHIHQPRMVRKTNKKGTCLYLNSGDWIEHLTALEYNHKRWELINYPVNSGVNVEGIRDKKPSDFLTAITIVGS